MPRRKDKCRSPFTRNFRPMAKWVNVFEKAVLDMKAEGLNVELKSMGWHLFEKCNPTLEREERVLECAEGEYEFAAIRGALTKLFLDTISKKNAQFQTESRVMRLTGNQMTDSRTHFANLVTGSQGVTRPTKLTHATQSRVRKRQTERRLSNVKWMSWPRWRKNWKTLWTYRTWKICESFHSPCMRDSPPSVRQTQS